MSNYQDSHGLNHSFINIWNNCAPFNRSFLFWKIQNLFRRFDDVSKFTIQNQRDTNLEFNATKYFISHTQKKERWNIVWLDEVIKTVGICAVILCYFDGVLLLFFFHFVCWLFRVPFLFLFLVLSFRHSHKMRQMHWLVVSVKMTTIQRKQGYYRHVIVMWKWNKPIRSGEKTASTHTNITI